VLILAAVLSLATFVSNNHPIPVARGQRVVLRKTHSFFSVTTRKAAGTRKRRVSLRYIGLTDTSGDEDRRAILVDGRPLAPET